MPVPVPTQRRPSLHRRRAFLLPPCGVLAWAFALATMSAPAAAAERLVDLAMRAPLAVALRWADQPAGFGSLAGSGRGEPADFHEMTAVLPYVEHRLDLRRWKGRQVRIHYLVPAPVEGLLAGHALLVSWEGSGALQAGRARAGERVPVFTGRVVDDYLLDRLRVTLSVDSRHFTGRLRFAPVFELEELAP